MSTFDYFSMVNRIQDLEAKLSELAAAFTVLWTNEDRTQWDSTTVAEFDALWKLHNKATK